MKDSSDNDILLAAVRAQTRLLKLPTIGRECEPLARQALAEGWSPIQFLLLPSTRKRGEWSSPARARAGLRCGWAQGSGAGFFSRRDLPREVAST